MLFYILYIKKNELSLVTNGQFKIQGLLAYCYRCKKYIVILKLVLKRRKYSNMNKNRSYSCPKYTIDYYLSKKKRRNQQHQESKLLFSQIKTSFFRLIIRRYP